jgi:hypothetical protein
VGRTKADSPREINGFTRFPACAAPDLARLFPNFARLLEARPPRLSRADFDSIDTLNSVASADGSIRKNLSAKPSTMHKCGSHTGNGQFLKMATRLAQADAAHDDISHPKHLADEVIQGDAAGDDVSTGIAGL